MAARRQVMAPGRHRPGKPPVVLANGLPSWRGSPRRAYQRQLRGPYSAGAPAATKCRARLGRHSKFLVTTSCSFRACVTAVVHSPERIQANWGSQLRPSAPQAHHLKRPVRLVSGARNGSGAPGLRSRGYCGGGQLRSLSSASATALKICSSSWPRTACGKASVTTSACVSACTTCAM